MVDVRGISEHFSGMSPFCWWVDGVQNHINRLRVLQLARFSLIHFIDG